MDALGIGTAHDGPTPTTESLSAALSTALAPETRARATAVAGTIRTDGASEPTDCGNSDVSSAIYGRIDPVNTVDSVLIIVGSGCPHVRPGTCRHDPRPAGQDLSVGGK